MQTYKTIEDIIEYMKEKQLNPLIIDAWDECPTRYPIYNLMEKLYLNPENRELIFENFKIKIEFTPGGGGGFGMVDFFPAEYKINVVKL